MDARKRKKKCDPDYDDDWFAQRTKLATPKPKLVKKKKEKSDSGNF